MDVKENFHKQNFLLKFATALQTKGKQEMSNCTSTRVKKKTHQKWFKVTKEFFYTSFKKQPKEEICTKKTPVQNLLKISAMPKFSKQILKAQNRRFTEIVIVTFGEQKCIAMILNERVCP